MGYIIVFCLCWGIFSVYMQKKFFPQQSVLPDLIINFVINTVLCPISILFAIYCYVTKTGWAEKK